MLKALLLCLTMVLPASALAEEKAAPSNPQVMIKTSEGDITVQLFADKAPLTVANFCPMWTAASTTAPSFIGSYPTS